MTSIDIERHHDLVQHLRSRGLIAGGEEPKTTVLAGGVSNRTVLIERSCGESWVAKQALVKLRVAVDWFSSPERIHREALALRELPGLAPPGTITPLVDEDFEQHIIVMEAVKTPHQNWKTILMHGGPEPGLIRQFAELIGSVHKGSLKQLAKYAALFGDGSFFESLRLEPYYAFAHEQAPEATFLPALIDATRRRRFSLVHGDYSPKNILVHDDKLILLDHEVAHFGDPAFDIGFALTHLLSKARHFSHRPPVSSKFMGMSALFCTSYRHTLGPTDWDPDFERFVVLHTLGCLLARAIGRSPLEYLSVDNRAGQRELVIRLVGRNLESVDEFLTAYEQEMKHASN